MGDVWLSDLGNVIRGAGLPVVEYSGWQSRSRDSGGYEQLRAVIVHHTASNPGSDGEGDAAYIAEGSDIAPIAPLLLDREGRVWVLAAGACNHAGSGGPIGQLPQDDGNRYAIGIEAGNNGVGEPWPQIQTDNYVRLVDALCARYNIQQVTAHREYAPDRKIDPAGQSPWASGSNMWDMDAFRADVTGGGTPPTQQPPTQPGAWVYPGEVRLGMIGPTVLEWQECYIAHGVIADNSANRDSYYGPGMEGATLDLQVSWGWSDADGVGGPHTWNHLTTHPCATCGR
jgi:hypothetical protein